MFKSIGVCGTGNMGQAIVKGLVASKAIAADHIYLYNIHREKAAALAEETGAVVVDSPLELAKRSQALIMGVKPNMMEKALASVRDGLSSDSVVISIAAGVSLESLAGYAGEATKIIRVMPNTPNGMVTAEETADAVAVFSSFGKAEVVDEKMIDAVCGLSGSGPAYVYLFIEALADGAVLEGMPRQMAYTFAAQTVLGAAKMVLKTGAHPGALKDAVCSPGGTTIEAVRTLEEGGFRAAAMNAVRASAEKNRNL